jgi:hypothetical protein
MEETAEALDLMNNTYQLQHLDIKPQNLFLMFQHVKVADFGLVKDLEGMQASVTGGVTPVYAAPETFDGWVSRYCDQYSLAIVYQELLTGQRPFSGTNVRQLILQHLQATPNLTSLPAEDQPIIARALAKVPDQRYPTCRDMVRLLRHNSSPVPPSSPSIVLPAPSSSPVQATQPSEEEEEGEPQPAENTSPPTANIRSPRPGDSKQGLPLPAPSPPTPDNGTMTMDTPTRQAPALYLGEGVLFPAVIIGLGKLGMHVLQNLRDSLVQRFDSMSQLPNIRLLLIDTDMETTKAATQGPASSALSVMDVLLTPLRRPSHYLKARSGRPKVETWLDPRMLYRIPRSQMTSGVRALGRLAFFDHQRTIVRRMQAELDACLNPNALPMAARQSQLGVRSNRPRVYIVTSLAGGTGSGMFLDLAYNVRQQLKQIGYDQPDVVGLFMLPPTSGPRTRTLSLGNTYAALTEINFFSTPGNSFTAQYYEREAPLLDPEPPFSRYFLVPMPEEANTANSHEMINQAAQFLNRDLTSPIGRMADQLRPCPPAEAQKRGQMASVFGLYQVAWPRREILRAGARRVCHRLVDRWRSRDAKPVVAAVKTWMEQQWKANDLGADQLIDKLRSHCEKGLGKAPEDVLQGVIAPLVHRDAEFVKNAAPKKGKVPHPEIKVEEVEAALVQFEELLGKPTEDSNAESSNGIVKLLREAGEKFGATWDQKLVELSACLIEQPEFRLAGAEEAVRQVVASIEQVLQHHEPLVKDLTKRAADGYVRLLSIVRPLRPGGRLLVLPPEDTLELLRCYPKWRFQSLMLQTVAAAFVALRGHLSDELREINFLRVRLTELARMLEPPPKADTDHEPRLTCTVFPTGCMNLSEATEKLVASFTAPRLLELDAKIQAVLCRDYTSLIHVCLTSKNMLKAVEGAMIQTAVEFAGSTMAEANVSEILQTLYPDPADLRGSIAEFYAKAKPKLSDHSPEAAELFVLAMPKGSASDEVQGAANRALMNAELHLATSPDDIIFYRESTNLPLTELDQMGPAGQEAYHQMITTEHFTPHIRGDIEFEPVAK